MSAEDALYRVMVPVANNLRERRRRTGEPADAARIVEATLQEFARSIALEPHAQALRQRLLAHLANGEPTD